MIKTVLFNGQKTPKIGEIYVVVDTYLYEDGMYGPRRAVVLKKVDIKAGIEKKQHDY